MHDFELIKQRILDRVDLVDLVSQHVSLKRRGRRWVGLCPFHAEKTPSFTVTPEMGLFKCFGCGEGGDLFSFVQLKENVSFIEAMRLLADRAGVEMALRGSGEKGTHGRSDLVRVNEWARRYFQANLRDAALGRDVRAYVHARGMNEDTLERFALGFAP